MRSSGEQGFALVWFALLSVGLFALIATFIDLGLARVTVQRMEHAAEFGALEGVRLRDLGTDQARREAARDAVSLSFDDNLDPSEADGDAIGYGAGSLVAVRGQGPNNVLGQIEGGGFYKPVLALNVTNEIHGDLVAGAFIPGAATVRSREQESYERIDFQPVPGDVSATARSLLVRLRRTQDQNGLDRIPGVSTGGPPLPFLFALGGTMQQADASYAPRRDGLTVRGASIATARPALRVSPVPGIPAELAAAVPVVPSLSGTPLPAIALRRAVFDVVVAGDAEFTTRGDGSLDLVGGTVVDAGFFVEAAFVLSDPTQTLEPREVGLGVSRRGADPLVATPQTFPLVAVPVFVDLAQPTIAGFAAVEVEISSATPLSFTLRLPTVQGAIDILGSGGFVAALGASATGLRPTAAMASSADLAAAVRSLALPCGVLAAATSF